MESKKHVFTPTEKKCFLDILKKYYAVIENKETDGATLRKKNITWNKITAEYNASPHSFSQATTKQLRRLWMNLKQRQREAIARGRQQHLANGVAPSASEEIPVYPDITQVAATLIPDIRENFKMEPHSDEMTDPLVIETHHPMSIPTAMVSDPVQTLPQTPKVLSDQLQQTSILDRRYKDCKKRANEKHEIEMKILQEQLRETNAKADLAELTLRQKLQSSSDNEMEMTILHEQLRESKAKADLAELMLMQKRQSSSDNNIDMKILHEQFRESKVKADLAELTLRKKQQCSSDNDLRMQILHEQLRESKAKADLAEVILGRNNNVP